MGYIGYMPADQAIREARGEPFATGADDPDVRHPPAWDGHPFEGASDVGLPDGTDAVKPEWWRP